MYTLGLDVGSTSTKGVLYDGEKIVAHVIIPTGWSPKEAAREALERLWERAQIDEERVVYKVGTGYGRLSLKDMVDLAVTEITCHARGIFHLVREACTVIDIGGQDTKVITINQSGLVVDFVMNDKCAAGTGRFLEVMAHALGLDITDFSRMGLGAEPVEINSMCTVFAESEVISLLASGTPRENIIAGLHRSIAKRIKGMLKGLPQGKIVFTGGGAKNEGLRRALGAELGRPLWVPEEPRITGALGAALIAWERARGMEEARRGRVGEGGQGRPDQAATARS
ncbi:MAG TPA: 2-hydroxyglutaryl-CoA dehydratase [Moorella mulderi]|nr:2-hydroxyglutaryl-CoA dehydratase [Moorella mulderi]